MTFSSEIYRRLEFGINILDEPDSIKICFTDDE